MFLIVFYLFPTAARGCEKKIEFSAKVVEIFVKIFPIFFFLSAQALAGLREALLFKNASKKPDGFGGVFYLQKFIDLVVYRARRLRKNGFSPSNLPKNYGSFDA